MAKNLKLNIKNAQLAEALKLNLPKKASPAKKAEEIPAKEVVETPAAPLPVEANAVSSSPTVSPKKEERPVSQAATPVPEKVAAEKPVDKAPEQPAPTPQRTEEKPAEAPPKRIITGFERKSNIHIKPPRPASEREPYGSSRPPYQQGSDRPPYQPRAPYQGNSDRPYTPRPASPGGYQPRAPYQGNSDRPYTPRPASPGGAGGYPPRRPMTATRPPFVRREGGSVLPPAKEPSLKEIPQQHQVYNKKPIGDLSKKVAQGKDQKTPKKGEIGKSFDVRDRQGLRASDDEVWRKRKHIKHKAQFVDEIIRPKELKIRLPITLKDLAVEMKLKSSELVAKLFMQGVVLTLNDFLDDETTVQLLGNEFDCAITIDTSEEERIRVTDKTIKQEIQETAPELLMLRPPVVTFMGHVDHGKTSLIDTIRKANVASTEAGAITQHIGAFKCHTQVGELTILDTPGHEAFSSMRERGADVTDIVVLVVAGDEGIKTQTIEAIEQAKKANVPILVALNKCDKPAFNAENVYRQLADQDLLPEAWGGSIITVNCSASAGTGIKELLEMLALQAEILELKANVNSRARGTVIESEMHKGLGTVATILVQNGTLHLGDSLVFDQFYARVKTMHDEHGKELLKAGPSSPVKITGLSGFPEAGSEFIVVKDEKEAREISEKRNEGKKQNILLQTKKASLENMLQNKADSGSKKTLNLILKADVQGSLEALKTSLRKIPSTKIDLNFISEGVGEISESDIQFAATSKATILGFHTKIESHAESLIKQTKVSICLHDIIYHAVDDVKKIMLSCLDKLAKENETGEALVKAVFKSSQFGNIAGCQITDGTIKRNHHARLQRNKEVIWKGPIASLKRVKEDVKEVQKGYECGILLQGFSDFKEGDIIQAYEISYLQQEL